MRDLSEYQFTITPYTGHFQYTIKHVTVIQPSAYLLRSKHQIGRLDLNGYARLFDALRAAYAIKTIQDGVRYYVDCRLLPYKNMSSRYAYNTFSIDVRTYKLDDEHHQEPLSRYDYTATLDADILTIKAMNFPEVSSILGVTIHRKKEDGFKAKQRFDLTTAAQFVNQHYIPF
jgi:hypothetical protein